MLDVRCFRNAPRRGVALIITLILLSAITFMAVTFLAVSRREKGSVATTTDQTTARMAADAALARAEAQIIAPILALNGANTTNGLIVSTNFINWRGFDPAATDYRTNVNYDYQVNGQPLSANEAVENLTNLLYDPRPPVFVTNRITRTNEFSFFLDLNRNGVYDTNGYLPEIVTNGPPNVTNFIHFVGDPEWIGVLERPEFPHSANNRFVARYAFIAVPAGNALDLNYIHNHAKVPPLSSRNALQEGFLRNQGVGSWELNLAGFLADLNTNYWDAPPNDYVYNTDPALSSQGTAFNDAFSLLQYRYNGNYLNSLKSVFNLFGAGGINAFGRDMIDGYSGGPLMVNPTNRLDADTARTGFGWAGADNTNHFFTTQELFDRTKTAVNLPGGLLSFSDRLKMAGSNTLSYDRYTFYRLLDQLGTDSAPDEPGRMNINYDNLTTTNGAASATNFVDWQPLVFFTNAAERLLMAHTKEWLTTSPSNFVANYQTNTPFGVANIPVWVGTNFVYSPAVNRLLQLAANIYDSTTNRLYAGATTYPYLPSVFRPVFRRTGSGTNIQIYIAGYMEETDRRLITTPPQFLDLSDAPSRTVVRDAATAIVPNDATEPMVYGVPLVIGAKKGLPNFNEFSMQSVVQMTRKLQVTRPNLDSPLRDYRTNQMFYVGISNVLGVEMWNSYRSIYTGQVDIIADCDLTMVLTNQYGTPTVNGQALRYQTNLHGNISPINWPGYSGIQDNYAQDKFSLLIPLVTNKVFLPDAVYRYSGNQFYTNLSQYYDPGVVNIFPVPQWALAITNKLRCSMVDHASGRLIDYVLLNGLIDFRNLTEEAAIQNIGYENLWDTNRVGGTTLIYPPQGVVNQIQISLGNMAVPAADWERITMGQQLQDSEIAGFQAFYTPDHRGQHNGLLAYNTTPVQDVPFVPTTKLSKYWTWQANDPLVHYTTGDLLDLDYISTNRAKVESLKAPVQVLVNLTNVNNRYQPWTGNPQNPDPRYTYNLALIDPLITRSDDWQFLTNKFPTIGWLGRVHRGTPWQTVYLKTTNVLSVETGLETWKHWTGNENNNDAVRTAPIQDRLIFDSFTTAFNDNASRGQLSINQPGLAAWSAVFSGVVALTNSATALGVTNIAPVGLSGTNSPLWQIVNGPNGINAVRANTNRFPGGAFTHLGDILAVPALTENSPFLNTGIPDPARPYEPTTEEKSGIGDAVYEWLPQQVMSLLRVGGGRYVIYSYGQTLRPAERSLITDSGPLLGLCTNYQVMAEVATRTVLRVDPVLVTNSLAPLTLATNYSPRIESFNILPPD